MTKIDISKIKDTMPKGSTVVVGKTNSVCHIDLNIGMKVVSEKDFQMIKNWQRQIICDALREFYVYTEGLRWRIYLKRVPIEFINVDQIDKWK